ncbi:hypothetical protein ADK54_02045 [Streptomyces sp. WM6378]|nr:hypothetical protein ADK54_02045 [Streptomyces sp. WM6378]
MPDSRRLVLEIPNGLPLVLGPPGKSAEAVPQYSLKSLFLRPERRNRARSYADETWPGAS